MTKRNNQEGMLKKLIFVIIIILFSNIVFADISITSLTAPSSISEGDTLELSFNAEGDNGSLVNYEIIKDNIIVSSTNSFSWVTNYSSSGSYEFIFIAYNSTESVNETRIITVVDTPLSLDISSPQAITYSETEIEIILQSEEATTCTYDINNTESGILAKSSSTFSKTVSISHGSFLLSINCSNEADSKIEEVYFKIDTASPQITSSSPSNSYLNPVKGSTATLRVDTNEDAICKYGINDEDYANLDYAFSTTGDKNHFQQLESLSEDEHEYYVRCKDISNNTMDSSEIISFFVNNEPSAKVDIEDSSPYRAGTYKVVMTTSESVETTPTLRYNFQNDLSMRTVSLTGSGNSWSGYIMIEESDEDSIGTFHFSGTDLRGLSGSEVTSGKLFLIDTSAPPSVDSFDVEQDDDELVLEWHYDKEEIDHYNIYRSLDSGVTYTDYYTKTTKTKFVDSDVEDGVNYYYKISTEDEAGNEGALSEQASGRVEPLLVEQETLSPSLAAKVDQRIKHLDSSLLDIDWSIRSLQDNADAEEIEAIEKLSLIDKTKAIKGNVELIKRELEKLKDLDLTDNELDTRLTKLDSSLNDHLSGVIKSVDIVDKLEYVQSFDQGLFMEGLNEYMAYKKYENNNNFIKNNQDLQEKVYVNSKVMNLEVQYLERSVSDEYTIITKTVTVNEPVSDVSIVENIPKIVEDNSDDIIFGTKPVVLNKDPVVEWEYSKFTSKTFYYIISRQVDLADAKQTKTNLFLKPRTIVEEVKETKKTDDKITGMVSGNPANEFNFSWIFVVIGLVVIAGLLVYYFFFLKEEAMVEKVVAPKIVTKKLPDNSLMSAAMNSYSSSSSLANNALSSSNNGSSTIASISSPSNIREMIALANMKANKLDFNSVHNLYLSILDHFSKTSFINSTEKSLISADINRVYNKLILFSKLKEANSLFQKNDLLGLQNTLKGIDEILVNKSDNSYFYSYVRSIYVHLSVSAIGS